MRQYYFAYHLVNGIPFAFAWVEEDGLPVGGIPNPIPGTKVEINKELFGGGLIPLEMLYPCPITAVPKPTPLDDLDPT